jgi:dolichol-phosphate mannosyltransferase
MTRARIVYAALAFLVAGPLLAPGLVLAVDLNVVPHPHLPASIWGLPTGTHGGPPNRLPIDLLFVAAGHLGAVAVVEKALLLAIVFLAGLGMHRLVPVEASAGRYFAGVLYAVNPFVYDRLYTGQWFLLLGYALLPWAYAWSRPVVEGTWRSAPRFALIAALVGVASPHMLALLAVPLIVEVALRLRAGRAGRAATATASAVGLVLTLLASLYWILPNTGVRDLWRHVSTGQLELYQTLSDHRFGIVANVLGLYGYWNDATPVKSYMVAWPIGALALLALASFGLFRRPRNESTWAVAAAGAFGVVLALGARGPVTGDLFRAVVDHVPAARSFREPQKGVALVVFAYAFLGSRAVDSIVCWARSSRRMTGAMLASAILVLPLMYGYRELGGLWGALGTSTYPAAWTQARSILDQEATGSNTLFLPWHGYFALSFANHRVVANPAPTFFDTPVVASRSVGEPGANDNSDARDAAISALLAQGATRQDLGLCLAPFGISHVLVANEADASELGFLGKQRDLVVERRWSTLTLYRNTHPTGLALRVTGSLAANPCRVRVTPIPLRSNSPGSLHLAGGPPPARATILLAAPFRPDWELGSADAKPFASGAGTAFSATGSGSVIELSVTRRNRYAYELGFGGVVLVLLAFALARRPRRHVVATTTIEPRRGRVWVVVPTYNEVENLDALLSGLEATTAHLDATVLIVDDASPDGTGRLAEAKAATNPRIKVLHRARKAGLGPAYAAGFRHALDQGAELVVQMDCDLSHDPGDVPRLIDAMAENDVVLGSRYVRGGCVLGWGLARRALSRGGSAYARLILGLPYADLTGGFKCFRRDALTQLDLRALQSSGYAFQVETTYVSHELGLAIQEIPIVFRDRSRGASKMTAGIALEALLLIPRLRLRSRRARRVDRDSQAAATAAA